MMPHVMLFATQNIRHVQELTYKDHFKINHVHDSNGKVKKKTRFCGLALDFIGRDGRVIQIICLSSWLYFCASASPVWYTSDVTDQFPGFFSFIATF